VAKGSVTASTTWVPRHPGADQQSGF